VPLLLPELLFLYQIFKLFLFNIIKNNNINLQKINSRDRIIFLNKKGGNMTSTVSTPNIRNEYENYIMDSNNQIIGMRQGGRFNQSIILNYEDSTEWVFVDNKQKERFCGFLFLQKALKESNLHNMLPAENKMAIHDRKIIYLSKYCGEKKPDSFERIKDIRALNNLGFTDTPGGANLREENDKIYIFDTEKGSFDKSVHEKI
jgi:hypothetical protein